MDTIVGCVSKNVLCTVLDKVLDDLGLVVVDDDGNSGDSDDSHDNDKNGGDSEESKQ